MKYMMCCGFGVLAICECGLHQADMWIPVTSEVSLFSDPDRDNTLSLQYRGSGTLTHDVLEYAVVSGEAVVGRSCDGYFIASSGGDMTTFESRGDWLSACTDLCGQSAPSLKKPSRMDDLAYWTVQKVLGTALAVWVILSLVVWRCRRRPLDSPIPHRAESDGTGGT